jgi:hypothetical protein
MVGIELHDISHLPDRSLESVKANEENNINMTGKGIIETSQAIPVAGNEAQKIAYTIPGENNERINKLEIDVLAYNREYKIILDPSGNELYKKYITTVENMVSTFEINQPTFEETAC